MSSSATTLELNPKPKSLCENCKDEAKSKLRWVALFLGELRDGLTMINMQSAYLIVSRHYTEKQAGVLFFVFGMSQFIFQTPAGYLMDYSDSKLAILGSACFLTTSLTVITAMFASDYASNFSWMILVKFFQGAVTSLIPPGLNSITQGIVGSSGMTQQVSRNEMMNHFGTACIVLIGSILATILYPDKMAYLFVISPIACAGVLLFLGKIKPESIDHDAARGLKAESSTNATSSIQAKKNMQTKPSFNFGWGQSSVQGGGEEGPKADTPLHVLRDPVLMTFTAICFLFHTSNGCVLPLVMQSLALGGGRTSMLFSGLCIIIAQLTMVVSAKICGDYSGKYGRKPLFLFGLFTVSVRCLLLMIFLTIQEKNDNLLIQCLILSTQLLDGVGAGTFGTMYILVTSDISAGSGRFSFTLGITTAAMNIGGTFSGYLGEALAEDLGYKPAFLVLGSMSLIPALLYLFAMPETVPSKMKNVASVCSMASIKEEEKYVNMT